MDNAKRKIVIVGPVYPYKGGIAHYTSLLYKALNKKYDVKLISFKFQYPTFLYPGQEQKDYANDQFKVENTCFLINTIHPGSWIRTVYQIKKYGPDVIILQWWNPFFAPSYFVISLLSRILTKTKIIFTCHNVLPHDRMPFDKQMTRLTLGVGHHFIVQSGDDENKLLALLPKANYKRAFHPTYNVFKIEDLPKVRAREMLGIGARERVLLFFGFIREYKGLQYLIRAMPQVFQFYEDIKLLIVGDFYDNKQKYVEDVRSLGLTNNVKIYDGYIPDKEVGKFFAASDIVVLPYISATQSGIVQIAYGFERPVIVTNVGGLPDVVADNRTGYVVEPHNSAQLADAIIKYFAKNKERTLTKNIKNDQEKYSWDRMVEVVEALLNW
ncbi:glycosyltransferase [Metallumcola ferriviriculae]|uniref:Glycosyltransferase n=1 Tax=Metallumcola ferriviriculae TaxID=3039180 RepID=A0AAU0UL06_9FIRM|nr:glycosyltransferase [Desulfitibacteraceae bacterium MK1]